EESPYAELGNVKGGSFIHYPLPTAVETPKWETGHTITPSPHHPIGAKGVGESAAVGAPAAIANAVVDAPWHLGVRHVDIPITPAKVWKLLPAHGATDRRRLGRSSGGARAYDGRKERRGRRMSDWLPEAEALARRGEPFAVATVVRCERPTSAKPGAKALIRQDGTVSGWIGGNCAE